MSKLLAILFAIAAVIVGLFAYSQSTALRHEEERVHKLEAKLDEMSKATNLNLQERCAAQSRTEFMREGWDKNSMADFTNHYNERLNRCFIEIGDTDAHSVRGVITTSKILSDAFEGKVYGSYIWSTQAGKKYWEVSPLECKVTLPTGEERQCHSSDEFDSLVKQYME